MHLKPVLVWLSTAAAVPRQLVAAVMLHYHPVAVLHVELTVAELTACAAPGVLPTRSAASPPQLLSRATFPTCNLACNSSLPCVVPLLPFATVCYDRAACPLLLPLFLSCSLGE